MTWQVPCPTYDPDCALPASCHVTLSLITHLILGTLCFQFECEVTRLRMPCYRQPNTLTQLALRSLADFVWHISQQLLGMAVYTSTQKSGKYFLYSGDLSTNSLHGIQESSQHLSLPEISNYNWEALQQFLQPGLPQTLANKVASYLMDALARLMKESYSAEVIAHDGGVGIIEMLVLAVIHPHISELALHHFPDHLCLALCKHLHMLTELKVLKLPAVSTKSIKLTVRDLVRSSISSLRNLVVFIYDKNCTDSILEVMSINCLHLEYLSVMFSKKVTDQSVDSIKKFQNLKTLNIWGTFITQHNCSQLLDMLLKLENFVSDQEDIVQGVTKCTLGLKSLIITNLTSPQLLVKLCPHLTQLTMHGVHCSLNQLTVLTSLQELAVSNCDFSVIETFLCSRGEQLMLLKLKEVSAVNIKYIAYCAQLKTLHLSVCSYVTDRDMPFGDLSSLHYKNLQHLTIRGYHLRNFDILLSAYPKLMTLNLLQVPVLRNKVIVDAVTAGKWQHLEVVSFNECGCVEVETLKLLVHSCFNLRKIVYLRTEDLARSELQELFMLEQNFKQNNLDIEMVFQKETTP